jgi:hypothetical protein
LACNLQIVASSEKMRKMKRKWDLMLGMDPLKFLFFVLLFFFFFFCSSVFLGRSHGKSGSGSINLNAEACPLGESGRG